MAQYPNLYPVELTKGPAVVQLEQMFLGDVLANRIGAIVTENGEAVTLGGTCSGTAILSNGGTVTLTGTVSGNTCYIDLPSAVYAVEGPVEIFVANVSGGETTTLVAAFGNVRRTQTGSVIDPGTIIPSVSALIDAIDAAVASIPADYSALLAAVAPTFSPSENYIAGRYVWYSGNLYRFKSDHAAGSWTGTDAVQVPLADDVSANHKESQNNDNVAFALIGESDLPLVWAKKHYIHQTTGVITYSATGTASVTQLIRIPDGATAYINSYNLSARYGLYDRDGNTIQVVDGISGINIQIPSTAGYYFALQYNSLTDSTLATVSIHFEYPNQIAHESDVNRRVPDTNACGFSNEQASVTGNPIVVHDAENGALADLSVADGASGEVLSLCGKNLFNFQHKTRMGLTNNGVTFLFNRVTQAYTITSETGATAATVSADATCVGCTALDGVTAYHNYHFRMKVDTAVTITPGYQYEPYYDDGIKMTLIWVESGEIKTLAIGHEGITFIALAGVEYGIRVLVAEGWTGNVTLRPQVEIGTEATAFEQYRGYDLALPLADGANQFSLPYVALRKSVIATGLTVYFDYLQQTVDVVADAPSGNKLVYNSGYDGLVNSASWYYLSRFTPGAVAVMCPGVPEELVGMIRYQVSDGTNIVIDNSTATPRFFTGESGKQYGFRIVVTSGAKFHYTFKLTLPTGKLMLKELGTVYPAMSLYTSGSATVSATYSKAKLSDEIRAAVDIAQGVKTLTGGRIVNALSKLSDVGPVVCFIDDDTTSPTLVQRFHDIFAAEGVVGNYAVETRNVANYSDTMPDLLRGYEQEGFGMLYHCYKQDGDADRYWESGNPAYDEDLIRANFYRGLREYKELGFVSARYWVTPYGVNDQFIQNLAKEADMECLLSCPTANYTCNGILTLGSNVKRYNMPRAIFLSNSDNDWQLKKLVDGCAADKGWLVIVTHVNSWPAANVATNTTRLTALIQYVKAAGCKIQNFMAAYQTFKPLLMLNELF